MENRIIILFFMLLSLFLLFSAASAILTALRRRSGCRLSSVVWGVLFILPLLPFSLPVNPPAELLLTVDAAGNRVVSIEPASEAPAPSVPCLVPMEDGSIALTDMPEKASGESALPDGFTVPAWLWESATYVTAFSLFLWITLALAHLTHRICAYAESIRYLTSRSAVCHDERLCAVFRCAAGQVRLHRKPVLRVVEEGIHLSPCTAGFLTPTVYISALQSRMAADELEYIFLHELCHVKRHDFFLKTLALVSTSVHFPAPFAGEVRRQVYEDCELGCDRMVLSLIGRSRCSRYMQTILAIAEQKLRGDVIRGELFSYASGAKELLLRRYRNLLEEKQPASPASGIRIGAALLSVAFLHLGMFSLVDTRPADDPLIRLENGFLEAVLREYYLLPDAAPLTMTHLDGIYSLEFSLSRKLEKNSSLLPADTLVLCCTVNEGKYYLEKGVSGEQWTVILQQDGLADGITPDGQHTAESRIPIPDTGRMPLWLDVQYDCGTDILPDVCTLAALERYLPDDPQLCREILSCYTCLDGTDEAVDRYAAEVFKTVIRETGLDADAAEAEVTAAFADYCEKAGIAFDPALNISEQLRRHKREQISAVSPAALIRPMAFRDPEMTVEEMEKLTARILETGTAAQRYITGISPDVTGRYALDLSDLSLFGSLRTVILNDRLTMADQTPLTASWCAVVER